MCAELRLPDGSTYRHLDPTVWRNISSASDRVLTVLTNMLRARGREIQDLPVVSSSASLGSASLYDVPLSRRSRNGLENSGLLSKANMVAQMRIGSLLQIPALGCKSLLEIACVTEALMVAQENALQQLTLPCTGKSAQEWVVALNEFATKPWSTSISEKDARFSRYLPSKEFGTVASRIEQILAEPNSLSSLAKGPVLVSLLEKMQVHLQQTEELPLDAALAELLNAFTSNQPRQALALSARFGWGGEAPKTLEESAAPLQITRERVRQIEERFLKKLPSETYLPQLDRAIELLEKNAPLTPESAADLLLNSGICRNKFASESVIGAARIFGRQTDLRVHTQKNGRLIVGSHSRVRSVAAAARKLSGMAGVGSVHQVSMNSSGETSSEDVKRILSGLSNFEFLNEDWFWATDLPTGRNRLTNITRRILSVAAPQSIHCIRDGVRRAFTYRAKSNTRYEGLVTPPSEVLTAFFTRSPEFKLQGDQVSPTAPLNYQDELGDMDRALVDIFRSTNTGVLDRRAVVEAALARSLNANSISIFLTYSPILEHVGLDMWKLRGVRVDPQAIEALREANANEPRERRILNYGWRVSGQLWVAGRLPYSSAGLVLGIPGPLRRYLENSKFAAVDKVSRMACGSIAVNDAGTSFGYGSFVRISGAEPGDVLLVEFDLARSCAELSIVDDVVLEEDELSETANA